MIDLLWGETPLIEARMDQDSWKNQDCWNIEELPQLDLIVLLSIIDSIHVLNAIYLKEYVYSWMIYKLFLNEISSKNMKFPNQSLNMV